MRRAAEIFGIQPRCPSCGNRVLRVRLPDGRKINVLLPAALEPAIEETAASKVICHRSWCHSDRSSGMGSDEVSMPEGNGT